MNLKDDLNYVTLLSIIYTNFFELIVQFFKQISVPVRHCSSKRFFVGELVRLVSWAQSPSTYYYTLIWTVGCSHVPASCGSSAMVDSNSYDG